MGNSSKGRRRIGAWSGQQLVWTMLNGVRVADVTGLLDQWANSGGFNSCPPPGLQRLMQPSIHAILKRRLLRLLGWYP